MTEHRRHDALTDRDLAGIGLDLAPVRKAASEGFLSLTLIDAARLAATLGGSLDWLAGRQSDPARPPRR